MKVNKSTSKDKSRKGHSRKEERPGGPLITSFFKPRATISATDCEGRTEHIQLDTAQTDVLNRARKDGGSVFFTGAAGTGKSILLRAITSSLRKKFTDPHLTVAVTASTGLAAHAIGGVTIHSWSGVQCSRMSAPELIKSVKKDRAAVARWKATKVLIIDEISMIDCDFFQKLSDLGCSLRGSQSELFGGIQIIMSGDFFQLPPVTSDRPTRFAFESTAWKKFIGNRNTVILQNVYRQADQDFIAALTEIREGIVSDTTDSFFRNLSTPLNERVDHEEAGNEPRSSFVLDDAHRLDTYASKAPALSLYPRRVDVEEENARQLSNIDAPTFTYDCTEGGSDPHLWLRLLASVAPERLTVKKGAQVMLLKNIDATNGLVNGSIGTVIGFYTPFDVISSSPDGYHAGHIRSVVVTDDGKPVFRTEVGLADRPTNTQRSQQSLNRLFKDDDQYPLVAFPLTQSLGTESVLLMRHRFRHIDMSGKAVAWRDQIPLNVSYAISIHKSQGQTIERLKVNLEGAFEKGQVYVALSRATRPSGLQVNGFQRTKVEAHPKVVEWHRSLLRDSLGPVAG